MKKLILFIIALVASVAMYAQSNVKVLLKPDMYIYEYTGVAADKVDSTTTSWVKEIQVNKKEGLYYDLFVKVADGTPNAQCKIYLSGKKFASDSYVVVDSLKWHGTGTDTIFRRVSNTNKTYNRYLKIEVKQVANTTKIVSGGLSLKK